MVLGGLPGLSGTLLSQWGPGESNLAVLWWFTLYNVRCNLRSLCIAMILRGQRAAANRNVRATSGSAAPFKIYSRYRAKSNVSDLHRIVLCEYGRTWHDELAEGAEAPSGRTPAHSANGALGGGA
jgi:hypothetical protein